MSTKIYNAYRSVKPVTSIRDMHALSERIRRQLEPVSRRAFYRHAASIAVDHIDYHLAMGKPMKDTAGTAMYESYEEGRQQQRKGYRSVFWDVNAEWVFFPQSHGFLLLKIYAENAVAEGFGARPHWRDYHFQNNTDRPKHISLPEWRERERTWDKIFNGRVPAQAGYTTKLWGDYNGPDIGDAAMILKHQLGLENRAIKQAEAVLRDRFFQANPTNTTGEVSEVYYKFRAICRTPEGRKQITDEAMRIHAILPKRITPDMLKRTDISAK